MAMSSPNFRRRRSGFSLIELVMVLAIMAILAGIAVPRFGRASARYRVEAAAKRIASDLQQAQQRAKAGSGACVVAFNSVTETCKTTLPTIGGVAGKTLTTDFTLPPYKSVLSTAQFSTGSSVTFDGFGVPSAGGTVVVVSGNEQRTITLSAVSGATAVTSP